MEYEFGDLPHLDAEGIEYSERVYPDDLERAVGSLDITPDEADFVDYKDKTVSLYRGDSRENLEDMGYDPEEGSFENGVLSREFPVYFTTSRDEALDHADRKLDTDETYLIEVKAPFDSLGVTDPYTPVQVARHHKALDFEPEKMYFNQPNPNWDSLEWISPEIPENWIKDIEKL